MGEIPIDVEVAYATAERQLIVPVRLAPGATAGEAVRISGILHQFPEIDGNEWSVGVFGRICAQERLLEPGDRVEIYRPLLSDPKEKRRLRAARA
ncbi:MAG: RnfH family protein [Gammaproteobacteria bacterium]